MIVLQLMFISLQAMGLSKPVFDGIKFADYKKPTPIQRAVSSTEGTP